METPTQNDPPVTSTDLFAERCRRWNFEATETDILVCYDHHEKGQKCEYERMTPEDAVKLIENLRSESLKFRPANVKSEEPSDA